MWAREHATGCCVHLNTQASQHDQVFSGFAFARDTYHGDHSLKWPVRVANAIPCTTTPDLKKLEACQQKRPQLTRTLLGTEPLSPRCHLRASLSASYFGTFRFRSALFQLALSVAHYFHARCLQLVAFEAPIPIYSRDHSCGGLKCRGVCRPAHLEVPYGGWKALVQSEFIIVDRVVSPRPRCEGKRNAKAGRAGEPSFDCPPSASNGPNDPCGSSDAPKRDRGR